MQRFHHDDMGIYGGTVVVNYTDRGFQDPMATALTVHKSTALELNDGRLAVIATGGERDQMLAGWVTIGHEVRSFEACLRPQTHWLMGDSPALREIAAAFRQALPDATSYQPVFMILAGSWIDPPVDGFGANYAAAFRATKLVRALPGGRCSKNRLVFDSSRRLPGNIDIDLTRLDHEGLQGAAEARRALTYEFCIPDNARQRDEVKRIDATLQLMCGSPGRIGCDSSECLCIGSTHQKGFRKVLTQLAALPYVQRIEECFFE